MELTYRPRRLRRTPALRAMVREHSLSAADFIYRLFVHEGAEVEPIAAMPGASRWSLAALTGEVPRAYDLGVRCIVLFPGGGSPDPALRQGLDAVSSARSSELWRRQRHQCPNGIDPELQGSDP